MRELRRRLAGKHGKLLRLRDDANAAADTLRRHDRAKLAPEQRELLTTSVGALHNVVLLIDFAFDLATLACDDSCEERLVNSELTALSQSLSEMVKAQESTSRVVAFVRKPEAFPKP